MKKLTKYLLTGAVAVVMATIGCSLPTFAEDGEPVVTSIEKSVETITIEPTFVTESQDDGAAIRLGKNVIYAGNNMSVDSKNDGIALSAGNILQINSQSDYAFLFGNTVDFAGETKQDIFAAGNIIKFSQAAKIGRDIFATGNRIIVSTNLSGDFSAAADTVIIEGVTIRGNVNLSVNRAEFRGKVIIEGKLNYNDDAEITGLENAAIAEVETYKSESHSVSAGKIWLAKIMSMCGVLAILIILTLFVSCARMKGHIAAQSTTQALGANMLRGLVFMLAVPLIALALFITFFAASAGIVLLGIYIVMLYLAQAFTGAWLGYVIVEKLCHNKLPIFLEGAIGIIIIGCLSMLSGVGLLVNLATMLIGTGLMISWARPGKKLAAQPTSNKPASLENPFRGQSKKSSKTTKSSKAATSKSAKTTSKTARSKTSKK